MGEELVAGPHHELVSRLYGATAVKQDAAFVRNCQQIGFVFVTSTVDVPVFEERSLETWNNRRLTPGYFS